MQGPYDPASNGNPFETLVPRGIGESLQAALAEITENRGPITKLLPTVSICRSDLQDAMAAEQIYGVARFEFMAWLAGGHQCCRSASASIAGRLRRFRKVWNMALAVACLAYWSFRGSAHSVSPFFRVS